MSAPQRKDPGDSTELESLRARVAELEADLAERNIKRRRYAQRDLLFRTFLEKINEVIWMEDGGGRGIVYVSPAFERVWGRKVEDLYGNAREWIDAIHPDDFPAVNAVHEKMFSTGEFSVEYRILRPDGSMRWIWDRAFPIHGSDGRIQMMIGIAEDVTLKRKAEREVRHAERLAAIGTLAAGVAHEINNPIGAILLAAEFASANPTPQRTRDALGDIAYQAGRCRTIVQSVLQFASHAESEKRPASLNNAARQAVALMSGLAESAGAKLSLSLHEELGTILMNETEIVQVLVNLVQNALEAGADTVKITTRDDHDGSALLIVSDDGPGVAPEDLKSLFDPFYTTKRDRGGTGLGLSISHGIITDHGGAIAVDSTPGAGTRMTIALPGLASSHEDKGGGHG